MLCMMWSDRFNKIIDFLLPQWSHEELQSLCLSSAIIDQVLKMLVRKMLLCFHDKINGWIKLFKKAPKKRNRGWNCFFFFFYVTVNLKGTDYSYFQGSFARFTVQNNLAVSHLVPLCSPYCTYTSFHLIGHTS